jgi:hypothetical protein
MIKIVILLAVLFSILSFTSCKRRDGKKIEGTVIKVTNIGLDWCEQLLIVFIYYYSNFM